MRTLFDNAIISHEPAESPPQPHANSAPLSMSRKAQARYNHFAAELRALIPQRDDLSILLSTNTIFEPIWRRSLTPDVIDNGDSMETVVLKYLQSASLVCVCKGLLYLALVLQQLPSDSIQHRLKFPDSLTGKGIIQKYIDTVEQYLMSNDK